MKKSFISSSLKKINILHLTFNLVQYFLLILRSLVIALSITMGWSYFRTPSITEALIVFFFSFITLLISGKTKPLKKIKQQDLVLYLDMHNKQTRDSIFQQNLSKEWQKLLSKHLKAVRKKLQHSTLQTVKTLLLPVVALILLHLQTKSSWSYLIKEAYLIANPPQKIAQLTVLKGQSKLQQNVLTLKKNTTHILELLSPNLMEIIINDHTLEQVPFALLKNPQDNSIYQTFQMQTKKSTSYVLKFSTTKNLDLYIPVIDEQNKLVTLRTKSLENPQVRLSSTYAIYDSWPDENPLDLQIQVDAKNYLQEVNLIIGVYDKEHKELVAKIKAENIQQFSTKHTLLLEPYMDQDFAIIEIIAEAIDRSLPTALVGYSNPLRLEVTSAYGRYQQALQTLHEVKQIIDQSIATRTPQVKKSAVDLIKKTKKQSEETPFFDSLDRYDIREMEQGITNYQKNQASMAKIHKLSNKINNFLMEHETLDDRARDRDFFVAARGLAKAIAESSKSLDTNIESITASIHHFLQERQERWKIRVERIKEKKEIPHWSEIINNKPFQQDMLKIEEQVNNKRTDQALQALVQAVSFYQEWLNELEQAEDKQREQLKQEMEKQLVSIREQLKNLQKKQSEISSLLDQSENKSNEQLTENWPITRLKQNSNIKNTKKLGDKLNSLVPNAGLRLEFAGEQMQKTVEKGNEKQFIQAETHSDLANRLLREASQESMKKQKQQRSRRRRLGRKYHGRAIYNSDINLIREYQVNRKYREDILDEVQESDYTEKNKKILDNYLRRIIR